jgi:hypothetical protein
MAGAGGQRKRGTVGELPKGAVNTLEAKGYVGKKVKVCGKIVATEYSEKSGCYFSEFRTEISRSVVLHQYPEIGFAEFSLSTPPYSRRKNGVHNRHGEPE